MFCTTADGKHTVGQSRYSKAKEMKREEKNPDSLIKSLHFESCLVKETFIILQNAAKDKFVIHLGFLVNSAYVTH